MNKVSPLLRTCTACLVAILTVLAASSCAAQGTTTAPTPIVQTLEVTQVITRDVTQEVTVVIEVPVTLTPTATPEFSPTPTITATITNTLTLTSIPGLPVVTIPEYSDCLYGPASFYLYKTSLLAGSLMEVVGRDIEALWLNVEEVNGWNSCWIQVSQADLLGLRVADLPVVTTRLPLTRYEYGPPAGYARRMGNEVTVFWEARWMSRDEVRGYLIEAWVCQSGQFIYLPVWVGTTYDENVGTLSVKIKDETGCAETSRAHIASAGKRGYTLFEKVFWPPP